MKRIALTAMAALIALAVAVSPATAETVQSVQKFTASVSPSKAGTKKKPRPVSLKANPFFEDISPDLSREVQFATVNANVFFPKGGVYNGKFFPSCAPAVVFQDEKQCPKGSQVGSAKGFGKGLGLDEEVVGKFFNIPGGQGTTLLVTGESPLIIREIVPAKLTKLSGDPDFSYKLSFSVPRNLQSPAPGVIAAVMKFESTIPLQFVKKGKKRYPLLASTSCPAGGWKFRYNADYTTTFDGAIASSQTVDVVQKCTK
jgi:hypothetical protein